MATTEKGMTRGDKIVAWIFTVFAVAVWALTMIRWWGQWIALIGGTCFVFLFLKFETWKKR